jgi:FkbM family methyltransferase
MNMTRRAKALLSLADSVGWRQAMSVSWQLAREQGPIRFKDRGRDYFLVRDRSVPYHLSESTAKLRRLAEYVRPDDTVIVDVGAHSGLFAAFAKERAPTAQLICIEADASLRPVIDANLAAYDNWSVVVGAATADRGVVSLYRSASSTQTSSIFPDAVRAFGTEMTEMEVPSVRLDDACSDVDHVDVLKIDVQGAEELVLAGGERTLQTTRTVLVEVSFLDPDPRAVLTRLEAEFGRWRMVNALAASADLVFEREPSSS